MEQLCEIIVKDLSRSTTRLHAVSNNNQSSRQQLVVVVRHCGCKSRFKRSAIFAVYRQFPAFLWTILTL